VSSYSGGDLVALQLRNGSVKEKKSCLGAEDDCGQLGDGVQHAVGVGVL
jgi:hypothetical protein